MLGLPPGSCMYIRKYVYMCICISAYMHICTYTYICRYVDIHTDQSKYIFLFCDDLHSALSPAHTQDQRDHHRHNHKTKKNMLCSKNLKLEKTQNIFLKVALTTHGSLNMGGCLSLRLCREDLHALQHPYWQ